MKTIITTLALFFFLGISLVSYGETKQAVADTATHKLTVTISGVNKRSGKVYVGLANDARSFSGQAVMQTSVDVPPSGEIKVTFDKVKEGRYAVRVYQDLNDNQQIDRSGMIPTEPFGFSNVTMLMGPPNFEDSAFELKGDQTVNVSMIEM